MTPVGFFYVIQLAPDTTPGRVKLGWTRDPAQRLRAHRCAAPTAELLKTWPCTGVSQEQEVIKRVTKVGCTRLNAECFDCDSLDQLIERVEQYFDPPPCNVDPPPCQEPRHDALSALYERVEELAERRAAPLLDTIRALERENGKLAAAREALAQATSVTPGQPAQPWWRRWFPP